MNNFDENKLLQILNKDDLYTFFKHFLDKLTKQNTTLDDIKSTLVTINAKPSFNEIRLICLITLNASSARKTKDYINACFNIALSNEQATALETNIKSLGYTRNLVEDIFDLADSVDIKTTFCYSSFAGLLKYLSVYSPSSRFEEHLIKITFLSSNLDFLHIAIQLISFLIENSFNPVLTKTEIKPDYYGTFFFKLFSIELFDNLLNLESAKHERLLKLDVTDDLKYFRDYTCLYFIFQYRLSIGKLREKYLLLNQETQSHFETLLKTLHYFQSHYLANFNLLDLKVKLTQNDKGGLTLCRLENCILLNVADFYTFHTNFKAKNDVVSVYLERGHLKQMLKGVISQNDIDYKQWEGLYYQNPILVTIETIKIITGSLNFYDITGIEKAVLTISDRKIRLYIVKAVLLCISTVIVMMNLDIANYGFLLANSQQNQITYVKFSLILELPDYHINVYF
jgi:hypothetical protein